MEILTSDRRKQIRLQGEIDGLRRARVVIAGADHMTKAALDACRLLIERELEQRTDDLTVILARMSAD